MLTQANHWMEIVGSAVDALLLCRVLLLRLQRVYVFITLACVLSVFFDVVELSLRSDSRAGFRVFLCSKFIDAFLFPLVGWDVFEEMKSQISNLRRLAVRRLISGLFFASIFGFLVVAFGAPSESGGEPSLLATVGLVLWVGSATATLAFLWSLDKAIRAQNLARPNNTFVWLIFWQLALAAEVLSCFSLLLVALSRNSATADIMDLVFATYGIVITGWCILRLRAVPSSVPSAPANASL
ncbi:MAG: hypothetical protein JOZ62_18065 [Acidobacteriaceae bacterium]|nr:hypothetical protein [Acidobacteriaceae bacterium]